MQLIIFFLVIAFVYSSVGFGGGSGYLAVLAFSGLPFQEMRLTALICNIVVVTGGTIIFVRRKELNFRKVLPLIATSIPMAYLGARLRISEQTFFLLLGCCLLLAGILLWLKPLPADPTETNKTNYTREAVLGAGIGLLSGMVGIGGGIFLSPLLNLLRWDSPKKIAATASFFILINSLAGIAGQLASLPPTFNFSRAGTLAVAVLIGGQLGARMGTGVFSERLVKRVTAVLVFVAGIEVLIRHIG